MLEKLRQRKAQSTLEYIILITAVIVIVIGLTFSPTSPFRQTLNTTLNTAIEKVGAVSDKWDASINSD